jgi:hypothetical protein
MRLGFEVKKRLNELGYFPKTVRAIKRNNGMYRSGSNVYYVEYSGKYINSEIIDRIINDLGKVDKNIIKRGYTSRWIGE